MKELKEKCYDLIVKTSIELGLKTDGKTMASLANILANDLKNEKRFKGLSFEQIQDAFHEGVRFCNFEPFLNVRTFYRWIITHKKVVNDAEYQVRTLGVDPKKVPYYKPQKLLK